MIYKPTRWWVRRSRLYRARSTMNTTKEAARRGAWKRKAAKDTR